MSSRQTRRCKPLIPDDSHHLYEELPPNDGTLYKLITRQGTGDLVKYNSTVKIRYKCFFNDPPYTMFDNSDRTMKYLEFKIGDQKVLPVWEQLVLTMKRYEQAMLVASSEHCFGTDGIKNIVPPNMDIKFIIELVDFIEEDNREADEKIEEAMEIVSKAKDLLAEKKYTESAKILAEAHKIYMDTWGFNIGHDECIRRSAEVYNLLAESLYHAGMLDACILICREAIRSIPDNLVIVKTMVDAHVASSNFEGAKKELNLLIEMNEDKKMIEPYLEQIRVEEAKAEMNSNLLFKKMFQGFPQS